MNGNVSRRRVLQNAAVVGAGIGVGRQATATELTVTKAGARDGFAAFYLAAADRVVPTDTAEGPSGVRDTLDWLGPERGADTYRVEGAIETFLLHGNATVRVDGVGRDPATLGRNPVDVDASALGRTLRVESTGTGFGPFAVTASGGVAPSDTSEGGTDGYTAVDWVGPRRGVDEVRFDGDITQFFATEHVRVSVDGREVPPGSLADGERTGPADTGGGGGGDGGGRPTVEFLDCRTARIGGEFAEVRLTTVFNGTGGAADGVLPFEPRELQRRPDGTFVARLGQLGYDDGVNGSVLARVTVYDADMDVLADLDIGDSTLDVEECYRQVAPDVRAAVEDVTPTGSAGYAVTFAHRNDHDRPLSVVPELRGTVAAGSPPDELRPGRNTFTVEWRPGGGDERLVWRPLGPRGWVGLDAPVVARTAPARSLGVAGPRAETSGPPTETTTPDAETASTAAPGTPTESPCATSAEASTQTPTDTQARTPTATETPTPEPGRPTPDPETAVSGETNDGTATLVRWLGLD